jgi:hypothetical protein
MTFEIGQKVKHRKYGTIGTFLGTNDKNQFTVILDNQELALDPFPIEYMDDWTSEVSHD